jgi:hypothetical protein
MKGQFVANVSFDTIRLINHPWDRINLFGKLFYKKKLKIASFSLCVVEIFVFTVIYIKCMLFSYLFFNINHKTDTNINE